MFFQGKRLAVIRCGALGDTLLLTPFVEALRRQGRPALLDLVVDGRWASLLSGFAGVDRVFSADEWRLWRAYAEAPWEGGPEIIPVERGYDCVLTFTGAPPLFADKLEKLAGAPVMVYPPLPAEDGIHVVEHYCRSAGVTADAAVLPEYRVDDDARCFAGEFFMRGVLHRGYWAIHPGSGGRGKNWPIGHFLECARRLRERSELILLLGPAEEERAEAILAEFAALRPLVARQLPLPRLAAVLKRCTGFLGNDSGISHLAALLGVPGVAVFVGGRPERWRPWGGRLLAVDDGPDAVERVLRMIGV